MAKKEEVIYRQGDIDGLFTKQQISGTPQILKWQDGKRWTPFCDGYRVLYLLRFYRNDYTDSRGVFCEGFIEYHVAYYHYNEWRDYKRNKLIEPYGTIEWKYFCDVDDNFKPI